MEKRPLGNTGLEVTPLGFGAAQIRKQDVDQAMASRILEAALAQGVNVIDTAPCYLDSEVKIGQALSARRGEFILISKCGHQVQGLASRPWSPQIISESVDHSLRRLQTDWLDVLLLHSCPAETLRDDGVIQALRDAQSAGKVRFIGYSGDGENAKAAIEMGVFDVLEMSLSICDQQPLDRYLARASRSGLGIVVKRPIANASWRDLPAGGVSLSEPSRPYAKRIMAMGLSPQAVGFDGSWAEMGLRFALFQPGVSCGIVGGVDPEHVRENVRAIEQGPLPDEVLQAIRALWREHDDGSWVPHV